MSAIELEVVDLTPEAFSPFGTVGVLLSDGAHGRSDVALDLSQGRPRFYIMHPLVARCVQRGCCKQHWVGKDRLQ